jgi:hypothetical protein
VVLVSKTDKDRPYWVKVKDPLMNPYNGLYTRCGKNCSHGRWEKAWSRLEKKAKRREGKKEVRGCLGGLGSSWDSY